MPFLRAVARMGVLWNDMPQVKIWSEGWKTCNHNANISINGTQKLDSCGCHVWICHYNDKKAEKAGGYTL